MSKIKKIAITGASGQIAYSLIFRIAAGEFLKNTPISLHLIEVPEVVASLQGLKMELEDGSYPYLKNIEYTSDIRQGFEDADFAILIGAKPRGPGMERKDLLSANGQIFYEQGQALNEVAHRDALVFVVGNPCNTNCLIALKQAKSLNPRRFHAMTRLDQNRAVFQLSQKAGVSPDHVTHMTIWGNHSSTQVPDFFNAKIKGKSACEVIKDQRWLEEEFIKLIQGRGGEVIKARGKSSAGSAAQAILDGLKALVEPTAKGQWYSSALYSENNPYGIEEDLIFSFPCRTLPSGDIEIVPGCEWTPFLEKKIRQSEKELLEEKSLTCHL